MNTYEDFKHYLDEQSNLINIMKLNKMNTFMLFDSCIKVMTYFTDKAIDGVKLDYDEQEVFELGYSYISDIFQTLKSIYEDYLNKDSILLKKFDNVIFYHIVLDDLEGFLESNNLLNEDNKKEIAELNNYMFNLYKGVEEFKDHTLTYINGFFETLIPPTEEFIPTYTVFIEIADGYRL